MRGETGLTGTTLLFDHRKERWLAPQCVCKALPNQGGPLSINMVKSSLCLTLYTACPDNTQNSSHLPQKPSSGISGLINLEV